MVRLEEPFCYDGRPASIDAAVAGLNALGVLWLGFLWRLLTLVPGDDVGGPFGALVVLIVLIAIAGVALSWFVLAWAYSRGHRWAWVTTVVFTPPLLFLSRALWCGDRSLMTCASGFMVLVVILIQVAAWLPATRRSFWHRRSVI